EGPDHDLGNGPYHQSARQAIYDDYYQRLEIADMAYPCFCTEEELALQRKILRSSGRPPRYAGTCRQLTAEQREEKLAQGLKPTLRFAVPENETIAFDDLVRGHQKFDCNDIGDFIIRRADGTPPFLFCNAVDDALMGVTHALRGEDHLTNTPRQLLVLEALGLSGPQYGHIALIVGSDGSPLSKRHGSRSIEELRKEGYLALAIVNYISRLGHYYGHDDFLSFERLAEQFKVESLVKSPAKFNLEQLHYWQKHAVANLDTRGFWLWAGDTLEKQAPEAQRDLLVETIQPNVLFPEDVARWVTLLFAKDFALDGEQRALLNDVSDAYFKEALDFVSKNSCDYAPLIAHLKSTLGIKGKALFMPLRIALTGESHGPELAKVMELLGADEVKRRLSNANL
ncbi:MAG: glutamate--tRNA ligase, partial [Coxiellaceae bacterium]|nr:glutamate--tRNA ligase [Coxiellaceae bacterium]